MKQGRIPYPTKMFLPIILEPFRYLLCSTPCITSLLIYLSFLLSKLLPYLNSFWETLTSGGQIIGVLLQ